MTLITRESTRRRAARSSDAPGTGVQGSAARSGHGADERRITDMDTLGTVLANAAAVVIDIAIIALVVKAWPLIFVYCLMFLACIAAMAPVFMLLNRLFLGTAIHDQAMHIVGAVLFVVIVVGAGVLTVKVIV